MTSGWRDDYRGSAARTAADGGGTRLPARVDRSGGGAFAGSVDVDRISREPSERPAAPSAAPSGALRAANAVNAMNAVHAMNAVNAMNAVSAINAMNAVNAVNAVNALQTVSTGRSRGPPVRYGCCRSPGAWSPRPAGPTYAGRPRSRGACRRSPTG